MHATNLLPVTESTLCAAHLGEMLQAHYNLGSATNCKLFRTGINHLYLVTGNRERYALRIYTHNWRTIEEINEELRLLLYLRDNNMHVSYPVAATDGALVQQLHAPEGVRYAVLFSFAEGKKDPRFNAETSYIIGTRIGFMHSLTQNFEIGRVHYNAKQLLLDPLKESKAFFCDTNNELQFMEQVAAYLQQEFEKAAQGKLRYGAVHMDIWFDNIHINNDEIIIFDFDFCGNGWLVFDVSYFLYQLFFTNPDIKDYESKAQRFLEGYESVKPLTTEERQLLPTACLAMLTFYLGVQCNRFDTWSNIFLNEDHLRRFTTTIKRWISYNQINIAY